MPSIRLNKEEVVEAGYGCDNDVGLELVDLADWAHDSPKYESQTAVFKLGEKYYEWTRGRSGSPFTEWTYDDEDDTEVELYEVEPFDKTVTIWKRR